MGLLGQLQLLLKRVLEGINLLVVGHLLHVQLLLCLCFLGVQLAQIVLGVTLLHVTLCGQPHDVVGHDGYHDDAYN